MRFYLEPPVVCRYVQVVAVVAAIRTEDAFVKVVPMYSLALLHSIGLGLPGTLTSSLHVFMLFAHPGFLPQNKRDLSTDFPNKPNDASLCLYDVR